jgi:2-dehydropantoate 2-reductase
MLVIGAGATGGYFGGRLAQAGRDVTFLVRGQRAEQLQRDGLQIVSPHGNATVQPKLIRAEELRDAAPFDVIFITTKAYSLASAMEDFAPAVGGHTLLLPAQNGMAQIETLAARFGRKNLLGGSVRIVGDLDAQGRVLQDTPLGELNFGELTGERTARILSLASWLQVPGVTAQLQADMMANLWQKWWMLASINVACILAHGSTGAAMRTPRGREFMDATIAECTAIAAANGYPPDAAMLADHYERMHKPDSTLTSSMYRDMTRGLSVEADHVLGDLLERGAAKGGVSPLITAAYTQLKVYEEARGADTPATK